MPYKIVTPNANQSPGIFPAQNNENFLRLKNIINADHNFVDTSTLAEGAHKKVTFIDRQDPTQLLAGTNGILYSKLVSGKSQLFYYNKPDIYQITGNTNVPITVTGSASIAANSSALVLTDPGSRYTATGWAMIQNTTIYRYENILRSGTNIINTIASETGANSRPQFVFSGNNLRVGNPAGNPTLTIVWSVTYTLVN